MQLTYCYTVKDMMRHTIHYAARNVPYRNVGMELKLAVGFNTVKVISIISSYLELELKNKF